MSQKWRKPLISDQLGPQRRRAGGFNGSNLMVGSQPASSTATDLTSERICCCRPLRTCPSAMAIITAAASFARAFNFAVRALENMDVSVADPSRHMLALSTYLGHANPLHTYWYLEATPTLLRKTAEAAELAQVSRRRRCRTFRAPQRFFATAFAVRTKRQSQYDCVVCRQLAAVGCVHIRAALNSPAPHPSRTDYCPLDLGFRGFSGMPAWQWRTRNIRLAAIKSFFRYLEYRTPQCLDLSRQVHAIPDKRYDQKLIDWLEREELQALVDAPDIKTAGGVRDRTMIHLAYSGGCRCRN